MRAWWHVRLARWLVCDCDDDCQADFHCEPRCAPNACESDADCGDYCNAGFGEELLEPKSSSTYRCEP